MPPKQTQKKQAVSRPDNSGIPKQDIEFKFNITIKATATELPFILMIQWFGITSDKIQRIATPTIETWQKIQGGFGFEKICDLIRVDDDFCKTLSSKKFYLYVVNAEDSKVVDQVTLDYSCLLMFKGEQVTPNFTYKSKTIKVMGIDELQLKLIGNKQLLQPTYSHYLNPFQVQVIGAKDVPPDTNSKYLPAYIRYTFFDGTTVQTNPVVGQNTLIWNQKHVFLAGLMDPAIFKQKLRYGYIKFQLHDRDQIQNTKLKEDIPLFDLTKAIAQQVQSQKPIQEDTKKKGGKKQPEKKQAKKEVKKQAKKDTKKKDVKIGQPILPPKISTLQNNFGVSAFYLIDFLKPSMRTARYKTPVVPKVTFEDLQSKNIDLNTTARNQMQKVISSNNYFDRDTNIAVGFTLSYEIGTFVKPPPALVPSPEEGKKAKKDTKDPKDTKDSKELKDPKGTKDSKEPKDPKDPKGTKDSKEKAPPVQPVVVEQKIQKQKQIPKDVFERVVYMFPYKTSQLVTKIDTIFYQTNIKAFSLKSRREVTTYLLKPQQKSNTLIDYMTGIELIDNQSRIYIIQGLREGSMKKLHELMIKTAPNTKQFKILKNSNVTFLTRLYCNFNIDIKRIRFRPSLTQILLDPIIYIKSKVPEEISNNLNKINQIKRICDDLKAVDSMNLWPEASVLIQIQRKFSDSLSFKDINGIDEEKKKKIQGNFNQTQRQAKSIQFMTNQDFKYLTMDELSLPKISNKVKQDKMIQSLPLTNTFPKKSTQTKTFMKDQSKQIQSYNTKLKPADIPPNQPIYIYSSQKNNWYQKQMREMRQKIANDKNHVYTYSKDYLGLSIAPRNLQQQKIIDKQIQQQLNISTNKFSSLLIKTKEERIKLPKGLNQQSIDDIANYPYYIQKAQEKQFNKNNRGLPINQIGKNQFQKYVKKQEFFSTPEVIQSQKITPVQRFKMEQQLKKKFQEENKKKLLGQPTMKIKKSYGSDVTSAIDRCKDIRQGQAIKKGIIDINKKTKAKRPIEQYQISYQLHQKPIDGGKSPPMRQQSPQKNIGPHQFNNYQRPQILTQTSIAKPLKKAQF